MDTTGQTPTASGTFTARRQHSSAGGHWGILYWTNDDPTDTSHRQPSPEALLDGLGQHLMSGARVRVTVEVIDPGPEPSEDVHASVFHQRTPQGLCAGCLEAYRDRLVILDCGHGRPVALWERDGRPRVMDCWDGWCPSACGRDRVVVEVPEPYRAEFGSPAEGSGLGQHDDHDRERCAGLGCDGGPQ